MQKLHISIISSCTAKKSIKTNNPLTFKDILQLKNNPENLQRNLTQLKAKKMYTGMQHRYVMEAIEKGSKDIRFDLNIISAGYGFLKADDLVYPYESTFSGKSKKQIKEMSKLLNIQKDMLNYLSGLNTDMLFILLGKSYFDALELPSDLELRFPVFVLTANSVKNIPQNFIHIGLEQKHSRQFKTLMISLKGKVFLLFIKKLVECGLCKIPTNKVEFLKFIDSNA